MHALNCFPPDEPELPELLEDELGFEPQPATTRAVAPMTAAILVA
jgi:hypothetical protein